MLSTLFLLNVNRHIALLNAGFLVTNCNGERRALGGGSLMARRPRQFATSACPTRCSASNPELVRRTKNVKQMGKLLLSADILKH